LKVPAIRAHQAGPRPTVGSSLERLLHQAGMGKKMAMFTAGILTSVVRKRRKAAIVHVKNHILSYRIMPAILPARGSFRAAQEADGIDPAGFMRFMMSNQVIGYSPSGFDPTVTFKAIPGQGGVLPDGLLVDTTKANSKAGCTTIRIPLGLFDHEHLVPFGAKAIRIHLQWKVLKKMPSVRDLPAVKVAATEQGPIDVDGQQKFFTFYTRNIYLCEEEKIKGSLDLPMLIHTENRVLPNSKDVIYGPLVFIPDGWRIEFRHYRITQVEPSEVPPIPDGEVERFIAWYLRNGFKPAHIDLAWELPAGDCD
jgi:hypothetical protein